VAAENSHEWAYATGKLRGLFCGWQNVATGSEDTTINSECQLIGKSVPWRQRGCSLDGVLPQGKRWLPEGSTARGTLAHRDKRITQSLLGHKSLVNSVAFSPDGKTLASGSGDYTLRLWSVGQARSGDPAETYGSHLLGRLLCGRQDLATGSGRDSEKEPNNTVKLWSVTPKRTPPL